MGSGSGSGASNEAKSHENVGKVVAGRSLDSASVRRERKGAVGWRWGTTCRAGLSASEKGERGWAGSCSWLSRPKRRKRGRRGPRGAG